MEHIFSSKYNYIPSIIYYYLECEDLINMAYFLNNNALSISQIKIYMWILNDISLSLAKGLIKLFDKEDKNKCLKFRMDMNIKIPIEDFIVVSPYLIELNIDNNCYKYADYNDFNYDNYDNELKNLVNLTTLSLGYNREITNEGIKYLINLTSLSLNYNNTITDEGLKCLTNITSLDLSNNNIITYEGLHLPKLKMLYLCRNKTITDEEITKLVERGVYIQKH